MPRKQYYLSGNSFTANDKGDGLTVTFDNPRELQQVSVTHAGFTLDLGGPDPPPQLYLRSESLGAATHSRARTVSSAGKESMSDVLGHVSLVQAHDLSSTGHFELTRPVSVNFGTFKGKMPTMDFFLTDHTGARVKFLYQITESIYRFQFAGAWSFDHDNTAQSTILTHTWGPSESGGTGGQFDLPLDGTSSWSYNYETNKVTIKWENDDAQKIIGDWDADNYRFTFVSESWASGFGFSEGDALLSWLDWIDNGVELPGDEEIVTQHPYASMALSVDAAH